MTNKSELCTDDDDADNLIMTIDLDYFEMTLEVLGNEEESVKFFETYENETKKDLLKMKTCMFERDWINLKRVCHTWKGRNGQIGFNRSASIAAALHDFIQQIKGSGEDNEEEESLFLKEVQMFLEALQRECEKITLFLKSQSLF